MFLFECLGVMVTFLALAGSGMQLNRRSDVTFMRKGVIEFTFKNQRLTAVEFEP